MLDDMDDPQFLSQISWLNGSPNLQYYREIGYQPNLTFVYFIQSGEFIKIGWSKQPEQRVDQIRRGGKAARPSAGLVEAPTLIAYIPGGRSDEMELHKRFAEHRDQGEWFKRSSELDEVIERAALRQAELEVDLHLASHAQKVIDYGWP